ncbi:MAG: alpha/beta hydrolase family protein [Shimia sp.]
MMDRIGTLAASAESVDIPTVDGATLAGTLFRPGRAPRAAIVVHAATGMPARAYRRFAEWLRAEGFAVLIYDYRDVGASRRGSLRGSETSMATWGLVDQPAAQEALEAALPGVPVWVIGHSLGAMMLPYQPGAARLAPVIAVASGMVHLSDHPPSYRWKAALFWYGPGRWANAALGFLPGRAFGLGEDVPAPAYRQWRRWCTTRGCQIADPTLPAPDLGRVTCPVKVVAVADDAMAPPAAVWRQMTLWPEAPKRQSVLRPRDYGLARIGHIDVLRAQAQACWADLIA